eukprot:TRINITY_DN1634_c0_g1_i2.p1 TRINITY_DN1634_c0_g1~~TRINITY_DN1634_c0_g1_i2.p1  ORF type:complete len:508 (-),score=116.77 TRINITY_DN1634_c0_g1_i2:139-1662(-)
MAWAKPLYPRLGEGGSVVSPSPTLNPQPSLDDDFLFAYQLQMQEDALYHNSTMAHQSPMRSPSKVSVQSFVNPHRFDSFTSGHPSKIPLDAELDEALMYSPSKKPHHVSNKPRGRSSYAAAPKSSSQNQHTPAMQQPIVSLDGAPAIFNPAEVSSSEDEDESLPFEGGMDDRSALVLAKLRARDILAEIGSIVAQGKEATVHHALTGEMMSHGLGKDTEVAVKVFKISKVEFKRREKYIQGERRFRHQLTHLHPMKMVKLWAEKELRNLKRLHAAKIPCPIPYFVRQNVIVMSFIGVDGFPSPRLFDVKVGDFTKWYWDLILLVLRMYQEAKLIHTDMGAFNVLVHRGDLVIIDLAQGVAVDHPLATDFLRRDCYHITQFFKKRGVQPMLTTRELYDFIISTSSSEFTLNKLRESLPDHREFSLEDRTAEEVWMRIDLPRTLMDVPDHHTHSHTVKGRGSESDEEDSDDQTFSCSSSPVYASTLHHFVGRPEGDVEEDEEDEEGEES